MRPLRLIAVHVEEAKALAFNWVLTERHGKTWSEIDRSSSPVGNYQQALASGLLALQGIIDDLAIGPREPDHALGEKAGKSHDKPEAEAHSTEASEPRKPAFFGFGPVR